MLRWRSHAPRSLVSVILVLASLGIHSPPSNAADGAWSLIHGPLDAPAGEYHSAIYDAANYRMLTFGYTNGAVYEMPLAGPAEWHLLACDGVAPPSWGEASAVYDPSRQRVLWFGGNCDAVNACPDSDVHVLTLAGMRTWSTLGVTGGKPAARFGHVAVYDAAHDRMIVYGGQNLARVWIGDVWALSLSGTPSWSDITPLVSGPGARQEMAAIYDPVRVRMLVHGGMNFTPDISLPTGGTATVYDDVWELPLSGASSWNKLATAGSTPPARFYQSAVYDPNLDRMIICNGLTGWGGGTALSDTWFLSLGSAPTWTPLGASNKPTETFAQAAIFDLPSGHLIVQGGYSDPGVVSQLSPEGLAAWTSLTAPEPALYPGRISQHRAFYDAKRHRMLVIPPNVVPSTLWAWSDSGGWSTIATSGTPFPDASSYGLVYDEKRDRLMFFGGSDRQYRGGQLNIVYALTLSGAPSWSVVNVTGDLPPGRSDPCVGYDTKRDRVIVFGGSYTTGPSGDHAGVGDTWALDLSSQTWSHMPAEPAVKFQRTSTPLVYDALHDAMIEFGGGVVQTFSTTPAFDAWVLPLGDASPVWTPLGPPAPIPWDGSPVPFTGLVDLTSNRILAPSLGDRATWSLPLGAPTAWLPLEIDGEAPPPRFQQSLVFDTDANRVLMLGGEDGLNRGDLWALNFDAVTAVEVALESSIASPTLVTLTWFDAAHTAESATVYRRTTTSDWASVAAIERDGSGFLTFNDHAVASATRYGYRLGVRDGATERFVGETWVDVPALSSFALTGLTPNPAVRAFDVAFSLPDAEPAHIDVLDLAGRRLFTREIGSLGAGNHVVELSSGHMPAPGIYLVRMTRRARTLTIRACVVR